MVRPYLPREIAGAAAQGQAGDAGRRHDAERHGEAERVRGVVDVSGRAARLGAHAAAGRIDVHALQHRQIDDEPVVAAAEAGAVVAAAADRQQQSFLSSEVDGGDDVGDVRTSRDQARPLVDHAVVHGARGVVVRVRRPDQAPAKVPLEGRNRVRHGCLRVWMRSAVVSVEGQNPSTARCGRRTVGLGAAGRRGGAFRAPGARTESAAARRECPARGRRSAPSRGRRRGPGPAAPGVTAKANATWLNVWKFIVDVW